MLLQCTMIILHYAMVPIGFTSYVPNVSSLDKFHVNFVCNHIDKNENTLFNSNIIILK